MPNLMNCCTLMETPTTKSPVSTRRNQNKLSNFDRTTPLRTSSHLEFFINCRLTNETARPSPSAHPADARAKQAGKGASRPGYGSRAGSSVRLRTTLPLPVDFRRELINLRAPVREGRSAGGRRPRGGVVREGTTPSWIRSDGRYVDVS